MKSISSLILLLLCASFLIAGKYDAGEDKTIQEPVDENLYLAGRNVNINAPIIGDLNVAGAMIYVNDTIFEDLNAAGRDILVRGYIGDDAKIAGENIEISQDVNGDLIVFGSTIRIADGVKISGDVVVFGGYIVTNGIINGDMKAYGGEIFIHGEIEGTADVRADDLTLMCKITGMSTLAAREITINEGTQISGNVTYWVDENESVEFGPFISGGVATFDESLAMEEDFDWRYMGMGILSFWMIYTLSVILTIFLLVFLLGSVFDRAGQQFNKDRIRNFGFGVIYAFVSPMIIAFMFSTIIGIAIGLLLLNLFAFSIIFCFSITSVVVAFAIRDYYQKDWNNWHVLLTAVITTLVLRLLLMIPFLGWIIAIVAVGMAFGSIIVSWLPEKLKSAG